VLDIHPYSADVACSINKLLT